MHSSIQFRHKATSTWGVEEIATVSDCSDATRCLQTVICAEVFLVGRILLRAAITGTRTQGCLQSQDCVSLEFSFKWSVSSNLCHKL